MGAPTVVWIVTTDGKTDQSSFLISRSEGEGILERRADRKPDRLHELWSESIPDEQDINEVLASWAPHGDPVARSGCAGPASAVEHPEQYYRTPDGRIGFWDPLASALAKRRTFRTFADRHHASETVQYDDDALEPIEHETIFVVLIEYGQFRRVTNHPTEEGARASYSADFLGRTYENHLHLLTELLVPIVSAVEHEQREYASDFTDSGYYPNWARTTLTWSQAPGKFPRDAYPARITGETTTGWVDRSAPARPDGKVPLYLGDRVRWELPTNLSTERILVFGLNWVDGDGDAHPYGSLTLDEDSIEVTAPTHQTIDCKRHELREWRIPGITGLDAEGEDVARDFIGRTLLYGDHEGSSRIDFNEHI